jgi:hypothetical protein
MAQMENGPFFTRVSVRKDLFFRSNQDPTKLGVQTRFYDGHSFCEALLKHVADLPVLVRISKTGNGPSPISEASRLVE